MILDGEFDRSAAQLAPHDRIEIGTRLLGMVRELGWPDLAETQPILFARWRRTSKMAIPTGFVVLQRPRDGAFRWAVTTRRWIISIGHCKYPEMMPMLPTSGRKGMRFSS